MTQNSDIFTSCIKRIDSLFEVLDYLRESHNRKKEDKAWEVVEQYKRNYLVDLKPKVVDLVNNELNGKIINDRNHNSM